MNAPPAKFSLTRGNVSLTLKENGHGSDLDSINIRNQENDMANFSSAS